LDALERLGEPKSDFEPELEPGEVIVARDVGTRVKGFGARSCAMVLTSRRLILHDSDKLPLFASSLEVRIESVLCADSGTWLDRIFGGKGLRIRMASGRDYLIWPRLKDDRDTLDIWIRLINRQIERVKSGEKTV
jgi:hypothetical protein